MRSLAVVAGLAISVAAAVTASETRYSIYRVTSDDTLATIADKFGVTEAEIIDLNPFLSRREPIASELLAVDIRWPGPQHGPLGSLEQLVPLDPVVGPGDFEHRLPALGRLDGDGPTDEIFAQGGADGRIAVVDADAALIHAEPTDDAPAIGRCARGDQVVALRRESGWLLIRMLDSRLAWMCADHLRVTGENSYQAGWSPSIAWLSAERVLLPARAFALWNGGGVHMRGDVLELYDRRGELAGRVLPTGNAVVRGLRRSCKPAMKSIGGLTFVPAYILCSIFECEPVYSPQRSVLYVSGLPGSFQVRVRSLSWRGRASYIQRVVTYAEGPGVVAYLTVCDVNGRQISMDGRVRIVMSDEYKELLDVELSIKREDFVSTTIGLGLFAHRELILSLGRIPYSAMERWPTDGLGSIVVELWGYTGRLVCEESVFF